MPNPPKPPSDCVRRLCHADSFRIGSDGMLVDGADGGS